MADFSERVAGREYDPRTRLRVSLYDNAYDALEKTHHQKIQHDMELDQLMTTDVDLEGSIHRLDGWRKSTPRAHKDELLAEASELPARHSYLLGAESDDKSDAGQFIVDASTVTGARGAENPSSSMCRLVAARNRIGYRDGSVRGVESNNSKDAHDISQAIDRYEKMLYQFRKDLQDNAHKIDDPDHSLFTADPIGGVKTSANDMKFILKMDPKPLRSIKLEPFKTFAECLIRQYEVLEAALFEQDQETSKAALLRMHLIGKFQGTRKCFAEIKRDIIDPEYTTLLAINDKLNLLKSYISRYQLFDGLIDKEYEPYFTELEDEIDELLDSAQRSLAGTTGGQHIERINPFSEIYQELYKLIDEFDIEDIVSKLPCGKSIITNE